MHKHINPIKKALSILIIISFILVDASYGIPDSRLKNSNSTLRPPLTFDTDFKGAAAQDDQRTLIVLASVAVANLLKQGISPDELAAKLPERLGPGFREKLTGDLTITIEGNKITVDHSGTKEVDVALIEDVKSKAEISFTIKPTRHVTSTIKTIPTAPEEVLYEADSVFNIIARLRQDNRTQQAQNLQDVVQLAFKDYSELRQEPIKVKVVRNSSYSIAETFPDQNLIVIDVILLDNFELLRQELISEEFRQLLTVILLKKIHGRSPTPRGELVEEFYTDLQKFEDILRIQTAQGRATLLEPLIKSTDKYNFYRLLLRAIPKGTQRDDVLKILFQKGLISEEERSELSELAGFNRDRETQLSLLNSHYLASPVVKDELRMLLSTPVTMQEIDAYEAEFNALRAEYRKISEIPYIHLADISIDPGEIFRDLIGEPVFSDDKEAITFTFINRATRKKLTLTIRRIEKDANIYLKIGNRTYRVGPSKRIDLSDILLSKNVLLWLGNNELVSFSNMGVGEILDIVSRKIKDPSQVQPGVDIYLYDELQDPISRTSEPELVGENVSLQALSLARGALKSRSGAIYNKLHHIAILSQSNPSIEGISYQQAIEDRILVTDELISIIKTAEDPDIQRVAREIIRSISLLAIRELPAKANTSELSLTQDEASKLGDKTPFEITSAETAQAEFKRLNDIFAKVVSEGNIKPYFIISIKNFTPDTFLAYATFLRDISRKYNGNITFLLSIEASFVNITGYQEPYRPFAHDMPGAYVARRRVIDVFGKDFYINEYIANITDGGEKTRAANAGVAYEQWSRVLTSEGISFLETNILTAGSMWLLLPRHGEGIRLWLASDGNIQFGKINIGGKPLSQIPEDLQIATCGPEALVMTKKQRDELKRILDEHGGWDWDRLQLSQRFQALWAQIRTNISRRRLEQRGIFVTDSRGEMRSFLEKRPAREIAEIALNNPAGDGSGRVVENIFFLIERSDISYDLVTRLGKIPTNDKDRFLANKPVSVFRTVFQDFLTKEDTPANEVVREEIKKLYGISYGEGSVVGDIGDLEQNFFMWENYLRTYEGPKEINVKVSKDVTIKYRGDKARLTYLLRSVEIKGKGTLEIGRGVVIESSVIEVQGDMTIPDRTKIIDSSLKGGKYVFHGEAGVVMGVDFKPRKVLEITDHVPDTLHIYGDETLVQIDYPDGKKYLVRTINSLPYKDIPIYMLVGGHARWDSIIRYRMGIPDNVTFETAIDTKLSDICKNEWEWIKLVRAVFSEDLLDELLYRLRDDIWAISNDAQLEKEGRIEAIADLIYAVPSARLTQTNRSILLDGSAKMLEFILGSSRSKTAKEEELLSMIRNLYYEYFSYQINEALRTEKARYDEIKELSYGEALFKVLATMHPMLLDIPGVSTWDIARGKDFISLPHYGESNTQAQAKVSIDALGMQERILKIRRTTAAQGVTTELADKDVDAGKGSPLALLRLLVRLRDEEGITQLTRKQLIKEYRSAFKKSAIDYEIKGLRLTGIIDDERGVVRLSKPYQDITLEDVDAMNKAAEEVVDKGLDRWRLDDLEEEKISAIRDAMREVTIEVPGRVVLEKGQYDQNWWEQTVMQELAKDPTPWGYESIVPVEKEKGRIKVTITREMLQDWSSENPDGRNIETSFEKYEEVGPLAIAGIRHVMNISNPHDTRQVKNSFERLLTTLSLALMVKIKYNKGAYFPYQANYGHEVRYNSEEFQDITTRVLAGMGFVCHVVPGDVPTAIWNTSTMGKFFNLPLSFCGTASHARSIIDGLKIMDYEGSQFLISDIEAMIAIQKAIIEKIKRDGSVTFYLSAEDDPRITDQLYTSTHNGMYVYREYQEKTAADEFILSLVRTLDPSKVHIDCMHGSAYKTLVAFFEEIGLGDLVEKIDWMHTEERPDFGNIGKIQEDPKTGRREIFDLGADGTQMYEKAMPDGETVKYFPVLCTGDYPERLAQMPIGDIILPTDMDHDRLYYIQILPNDTRTKALLDEAGVLYNVINNEKIAAVFIPNKSFHFLHEMNFERITSLMDQGRVDNDRTIVVLKTLASTPAVDKWAEERAKQGYAIKVINTAVGFAKLANVMYRAEGFMREHPGKDVIITDATGKDVNIGSNPIILTAWEESGGIITGITYGFRDLLGNSYLAAREKSATESIFLSLALISKLQHERKGEVNLAEYLKEIYDRDGIDTPIDFRYDNDLYVPGTSKEAAEEEKAGNERKNRIFGAYLSIAIAKMRGELSIEGARGILRDIFDQEYEARKVQVKNKLPDVLIERYRRIDFANLEDVWFTGDGVMFVFEKEGRKWFVLFRPSGTEPKLKSYGFGKDTERLTIDSWAFGFNENIAGQLPESFRTNKVLMELWGADGVKAVDKGRRMQAAWEDFGLVIDPKDLTEKELEELEKQKLVRTFSPPDNHLELINQWLKNEGLSEIDIDLTEPQAMPQEAIVELLEAIPADVYTRLGSRKEDVLRNEGPLNAILARLDTEHIDSQMAALYGEPFENAARLGASEMAKWGFETMKDGSRVNRLGWTLANVEWLLKSPDVLEGIIRDAELIRAKDKYKYVIFCGMGGSGLTVQTVKDTFGEPEGLKMYSLRTTDPAVIKDILDEITEDAGSLEEALSKTLVIPISKSGETEETVSHKRYFETLFDNFNIDRKKHMWVITDKGSPMYTGEYAQSEIQLNGKVDIGGRFTAPTTRIFLLPLALVVSEQDRIERILLKTRRMNQLNEPFIRLGAYLYYMASELGKDKLTFMVPPELRDLPMWSEQLFEESLGKGGKGVSVFYGEALSAESLKDVEENDRVFLRINVSGKKTSDELWSHLKEKGYPVFEIDVDDIDSIGGLMLGFQRTVATIAYLWGINFVAQPAVQRYKDATTEVMNKLQSGEKVGVPGEWKHASFNKIRLYYDRLIEVGALTQDELESEVRKLGSTMDDAAALYAAIITILASKPGFEAKEITSYGRMAPAIREILERVRGNIFTDGLRMPSKLGEGPDKNHSYQQNIEDGKDMWFSTYFMPLEVEQQQPEVLNYDDNFIRAQTIGTVNSIVSRGRKVALITFDSTTDDAKGDLDLFFRDVEDYLSDAIYVDAGDRAILAAADEAIEEAIRLEKGSSSRKEPVDSMNQIIAVPASEIIANKAGFEKWISSQPENVAVVIIAVEDEYNSVKGYENLAYIKVVGRDISEEYHFTLIELFGSYGTPEFFNGFKLGAPYSLDKYKAVVKGIASGV